MSGESYAAAVARIARQLTGADGCTSSRNSERRKCDACRKPAPKFGGTLVAGVVGGVGFGVCVHAFPCMADIREALAKPSRP